MTDQPRDPQVDERVRRLLGEARHDRPMPPEVADRMDRVLAELAAEPATRHKVVRLADRRRRAGTLLVAAAAVVVAGVGIGAIVRHPGSGEPSSTSAGRAAQAPENGDVSGANAPPSPSSNGSDAGSMALDDREPMPLNGLRRGFIRLRPQHFAHDVELIRRAPHARGAKETDDSTTASVQGVDGIIPCRRQHSWGAGRYVAVRYGAVPGYLVFRKPAGDTQVVDLYLCGARVAVRSVTLPRP